jgi:hypothetical protein
MSLLTRALVASALVVGSSVGAIPAADAQLRPHHDRLPAAVTVPTRDYDFELVLTAHPDEPGSPTAWVRRTDDVGRGAEDQPDAHGFVQTASWDAQSGSRCVASSGGTFSFADARDRAFTYGVAGRSVRRVVIVMDDGVRLRTKTTRVVDDGFRGWMVRRPLGQIARIDGFDWQGRRVASFSLSLPDFTDFGQADTCVPFPFP